MGKDYTPLRLNNLDEEKPVKKLYKKNLVVEASEAGYFSRLPPRSSISEIEVGSAGTKETIFRLRNGGFIVVKGTVSMKSLHRKDLSNPTGSSLEEYGAMHKDQPKKKYIFPLKGKNAKKAHGKLRSIS